MKTAKDFSRGIADGIPIMLGYLSVSFAIGIKSAAAGLTTFEAALISLTNLTSAGQAKGIDIIAANGTLVEMILVQLIINIRYSLMGLTLSQRLDPEFKLKHRLLASYGITDEIFALCAARKSPLRPSYMYGMILVATVGWVAGTAMGAAAGQLLPEVVAGALGIMLYGMFLAIIIPPARKERSVLCVVIAAALFSLLFAELIKAVPDGFAMIISAVAAAALGAAVFPIKDENENKSKSKSGEAE